MRQAPRAADLVVLLLLACSGGGGSAGVDVPGDGGVEGVSTDAPGDAVADAVAPDAPGDGDPAPEPSSDESASEEPVAGDTAGQDASGDEAAGGEEDAPDAGAHDAEVPVQTVFPATPGARCAPQDLVGLVVVGGYQGSEILDASATLYDRPDPWIAEPVLVDASCAYYRFSPTGFCNPPCGEGQVCGLDGECTAGQVPAPDVRLVLTAGGQSQEFVTKPGAPGAHGLVTLPGRSFAVEASWLGLTVTLPETSVPGELSGLAGKLEGGQDAPESLDLTWTPPADGGSVTTRIPINHHAGGPTFTDCAVDASTGLLHVDGAMLKPLAVFTGLEFQGIEHARLAAAQTPLGCVEIRFQVHQFVLF